LTAYRFEVEAIQREGGEDVVVERAPHCGSLSHLVRAAVFDNAPWSRRGLIFRSFALCRNRVSVETSAPSMSYARTAVPMIMTAKSNHISDCPLLY
jgi:hypothetical protein